jgi:hypothetical protein
MSEKKKSGWIWPDIDSNEDAEELAKAGFVGGGLMIVGMLIAIISVYFTDKVELFGASSMSEFLLNQIIQLSIAIFLTWRIYSGKGLYSAIILCVWVVLEVGVKASSGQLNVGWAFMWFAAIMSLVNSVRGSLACRKFARLSDE